MSAIGEVVRQAGLLLLAWTVLSVCAVVPLRWWMRRQAALNEGGLPWLADQPTAEPAAYSTSGPLSVTRGPTRR